MAFNFFRQRTSASILSMGIGSVGRVISDVKKRHLIGSQYLPFSRFLTIPLDKFLGVGESSHSAKQSLNVSSLFQINFPDEFPFGIELNNERFIPGGKKYLVRRNYKDEIIEISCDGYRVEGGTPVIAHVYDGSQHLQFEILAEPKRIAIESCIIKGTLNTKESFQNYLQVRGFNSSLKNFILGLLESHRNTQQFFNDATSPHLVPDEIPFKIELENHEKRKGVLVLQRRFEDEIIRVKVCAYKISQLPSTTIVSVYCNGLVINFAMSVTVDEVFSIADVYITRGRFGDLKEFQNFLEIRGIKLDNINFMFDYFIKEKSRAN